VEGEEVLYADLHIHTNASDGIFSSEEIVIQASRLKLKAIAITDHDTTNGIFAAQHQGKQSGVEVIPGVEVNTEYNDNEIHILGYFMDYQLPWFQGLLQKLRFDREQRAEKILKLLGQLGKPISLVRLKEITKDSAVGRPHIAKCLLEAGHVSSIREAFDTLIGRGKPAYVPRFKLTPEEAIKLIRDANGIPVLAHPGGRLDAKYLDHLVLSGLLGLEVVHHDHTIEIEEKLSRLADRHGLLKTGGSDFHGGGRAGGPIIGSKKVSYSLVQELKKVSNKIRAD
jgi:predicted metal-dependent phosphoesterase TrpH